MKRHVLFVSDEIRNAVIDECAEAAFKAYGSITSDQYIMEGPSGLAKRMISAIKALTHPRPESKP